MEHKRYQELCKDGRPDLDLPIRVETFARMELSDEDRAKGILFRYVDINKNWYVYGMYSEETDDYLVRYDLGLTEITEIDLIEANATVFRNMISKHFPDVLKQRWFGESQLTSVIVLQAGVVWEKWEELLPEEIGEYQRKVLPNAPIRGLNGSYIIGIYADKHNERGLIFYYNIFRNDFFAEMYCKRVPFVIHDFDAPNRNIFAEQLKKNLYMVLEQLTEK